MLPDDFDLVEVPLARGLRGDAGRRRDVIDRARLMYQTIFRAIINLDFIAVADRVPRVVALFGKAQEYARVVTTMIDLPFDLKHEVAKLFLLVPEHAHPAVSHHRAVFDRESAGPGLPPPREVFAVE